MNDQPPSKTSGQTVFLSAVIGVSTLVLGYVLLCSDNNGVAGGPKDVRSRLTLSDIPFDGGRAYEYLEEICALGPRMSGSTGMQAQQKLLAEHFQKLGGTVRVSGVSRAAPVGRLGRADGQPDRPLSSRSQAADPALCALRHASLSRPRPQQSARHVLGANDGGSGVAVLMELAHKLADLPGRLGVDFVLFDGEELVFREQDPYFYGSQHFAEQYVANPPDYRYRWGVLLDMVGDADLQIYEERRQRWSGATPSRWSKPSGTRPGGLGVREFIPQKGHEIRDDHWRCTTRPRFRLATSSTSIIPAWHT